MLAHTQRSRCLDEPPDEIMLKQEFVLPVCVSLRSKVKLQSAQCMWSEQDLQSRNSTMDMTSKVTLSVSNLLIIMEVLSEHFNHTSYAQCTFTVSNRAPVSNQECRQGGGDQGNADQNDNL